MIYKHKKGGVYLRLANALHSDDKSEVVIYLHLWPNKIGLWVRPKAEFEEPDRFRKII